MVGLRGAVRESLKQALLVLERSGCAAAGYRLAGETVERPYVVHLYSSWRLLLAFSKSDLAVVVDVGEHLAADPRRDVYIRLYEVLGMEPAGEPRDKPACCDDDNLPPVRAELVDDLADPYRILTRRRQGGRHG